MSGENDWETRSVNMREGMRRRSLLLGTTSLVTAAGIMKTTSSVRAQQAEEVLPKPEPPFQGKVGRTLKDSIPDFPKGVEAPAGAPNVLLILTDDVGFRASSTFGGPIKTPNFQRLADKGRADHRPKPPFGCQWKHHRVCNRLSRLRFAGA